LKAGMSTKRTKSRIVRTIAMIYKANKSSEEADNNTLSHWRQFRSLRITIAARGRQRFDQSWSWSWKALTDFCRR
jgi:hypothetical protein